MFNILTDLLAFGSLLSSILVITSKNPVVSVIYLICVFVNVAGYLILKGIGFIGIAYILVYVGAVAILFLFVIMMINIKLSDILETGKEYTKSIPLAISISALFIYEFSSIFFLSNPLDYLLKFANNLNISFLDSSNLDYLKDLDVISLHTIYPYSYDSLYIDILQIDAIGIALYTYGAIFLIIISLILLLAMVAPIFISRSNSVPVNSNWTCTFCMCGLSQQIEVYLTQVVVVTQNVVNHILLRL